MSTRQTVTGKARVGNRTYEMTLIENPTIDDIVISEMKVQAQHVAEKFDVSGRRVERSIRDFLVRLGVER